jgi:hypothetical protein
MASEQESSNDLRASVDLRQSGLRLSPGGAAVVNVVWARSSSTADLHLVFALVEILPADIPKAETRNEWVVPLGENGSWSLHGRTTSVGVERALDWYDKITTGEWSRPAEDGTLLIESSDHKEVRLSEPAQEPTWPSTVTLAEPVSTVPFVPSSYVLARVHHVLTPSPALPMLLPEGVKAHLLREFNKRMQFDIDRPGHLWQSAHIVAPDPTLRDVRCRLDSTDSSGDRGVLVTLVPRARQSIDHLTVTVHEVRSTGSRMLSTFRPTAPFYRVPVIETVDQIAVEVDHDAFGLVSRQGPFTFMRSMSLQMGLGGRERRITVPRPRQKNETYRVSVTHPEHTSLIGSSPPMEGARIFRQAMTDLTTLARAVGTEQCWFDGNTAAAADQIRELMKKGKSLVRIVDPYFGAPEVLRFLPAVGTVGAVVQVLTARAGLSRRRRFVEGEEDKDQAAQLTDLRAELDTATRLRQINPVSVRVMRGRKPAVHDRLLQVDDAAWLLGSSLNEFGSRGTMLVRLPAPKSILAVLDSVWDDAVALDKIAPSPNGDSSGDGDES